MGAQRTPYAPFKETWHQWECDTRPPVAASGYAREGGKLAHRAVWMRIHGPIPEGMHVLHHCDIRNCREYRHLWLGTNADNVRDREEKGRGVNFSNSTNNSDRPGDLSHKTKLFTPERIEIIGLIAHGARKDVVAEQFGVHVKTVEKIWRYRANNGWEKANA
jgi:hypothetical protein